MSRADKLFGIACSLAFLALGALWIGAPGLHYDEVLFAIPLWAEGGMAGVINVFHVKVPLMVMAYVGTLKTLLYAPVLVAWQPSEFGIRFPVIVAGAATVWLFFLVLHRTAGPRAARIGAVLLAVDTTFIWTTRCDWGPVALQHLLLMAGVATVSRSVPLACFLFGLGLWDKAVFMWALAGVAAAALIVFPAEVRKRLTRANVVAATAAFLAGCSPLLVFNVLSKGETFRQDVGYSLPNAADKITSLRNALDGVSLVGFVVPWEPRGPERRPEGALETASVAVSKAFWETRRTGLSVALLAALVAAPFVWKNKSYRFALVAAAVTYLPMFAAKNVGNSAHHIVLLWPLPHWVVAVAAARLNRWIAAAGTVALCALNLIAYNHHHAQWIRFGNTSAWTDATVPLAQHLDGSGATRIYACDWGISNQLTVRRQGRLPVNDISFALLPADHDQEARHWLAEKIGEPGVVFVTHTKQLEEFAGVTARLEEIAGGIGLRREPDATIRDATGVPIFEVFRLVQK